MVARKRREDPYPLTLLGNRGSTLASETMSSSSAIMPEQCIGENWIQWRKMESRFHICTSFPTSLVLRFIKMLSFNIFEFLLHTPPDMHAPRYKSEMINIPIYDQRRDTIFPKRNSPLRGGTPTLKPLPNFVRDNGESPL